MAGCARSPRRATHPWDAVGQRKGIWHRWETQGKCHQRSWGDAQGRVPCLLSPGRAAAGVQEHTWIKTRIRCMDGNLQGKLCNLLDADLSNSEDQVLLKSIDLKKLWPGWWETTGPIHKWQHICAYLQRKQANISLRKASLLYLGLGWNSKSATPALYSSSSFAGSYLSLLPTSETDRRSQGQMGRLVCTHAMRQGQTLTQIIYLQFPWQRTYQSV